MTTKLINCQVPLAVQKRRSRWDYGQSPSLASRAHGTMRAESAFTEVDRPKNLSDARERSLKAKRDWAVKNRSVQLCLTVQNTSADNPTIQTANPPGEAIRRVPRAVRSRRHHHSLRSSIDLSRLPRHIGSRPSRRVISRRESFMGRAAG